jgi:hypothetical protein
LFQLLIGEAIDLQRNKKHEAGEASFDWKDCRTHDFIRQKLDYIHSNLCRGKWSLAASADEYKHSSAGFYIPEPKAGYPLTIFGAG